MAKTIERSEALRAAIVTERTLEVKTLDAWGEVRALTRQLQTARARRRWWVDHIDDVPKKGKRS